jgi:hypothetical protein
MNFDIASVNAGTASLIFLATLCSDILWAFYIRRTNHGQAFAAATFSLLIALLGGFAVTEYVENAWYLVPTALGAFVGTIITVTWDSRNK